ncbi:MAG: serine/threonine-protein kinase [Actinomycetota bacterium]|nr:serine/threonine-protein kinase [Actinomycetota bacterium]
MAVGADALPSRYADARQIARGGMGEIFVAEDQILGRTVAIKVLAHSFARDEAVRRRFTREALAAARLSGHPHIVTIFDVGEADGRPFIVMEYLKGGTVAERARAGRVDRRRAIEWLEQAGEALDDAHAQGIVHRDVKPANLLLDERDELHVADFGIARIIDETTTGMTMAGTVLGTAGYLSPEQARGEPASPASDVYSLGIVAYELLTGGRPFEGGSATAEAGAHVHQPVPPASERGVGLPREIDAVFERVLAKDPARRYRTARSFVRALALALESGAQPTRPATRMPPAAAPLLPGGTPRRRSYLPVLVAAGLAALALAGVVLAAVVATGGDGEGKAADRRPKVVTREVTTVIRKPGTTVRDTVTVAQTPTSTTPVVAEQSPATSNDVSLASAIALTDQATAAMRGGSWSEALVLARRALSRLEGTGHVYEAYANYDVGKSLVMLGRCDDAIPYLDRSEQIQGRREAIDAARAGCR